MKSAKPKHPSQSTTLLGCAVLILTAVLMLLLHLVGAVDLGDPALSSAATALVLSLAAGVQRLRTSQPIARGRQDEEPGE